MLRLLLLLVLAYFAFRAARNLWQAVKGETAPPAERVGWKQPEETLARSGWQDEVEEARYRDL